MARDLARDLGAVVAAHDVEGKVDSCGGASRGEHLPVVDIEHVGLHTDPWEGAGKAGRVLPMSRGTTTVEDPGRGEHERAVAERDQARAAAVGVAERVDHLRLRRRQRLGWVVRAAADASTGDYDGVGRLEDVEAVRDPHADQPAIGGHGVGGRGAQPDFVPALGEPALMDGKDLQRDPDLEH